MRIIFLFNPDDPILIQVLSTNYDCNSERVGAVDKTKVVTLSHNQVITEEVELEFKQVLVLDEIDGLILIYIFQLYTH